MNHPSSQEERTHKALNILCKWRSFFAGWQLGTRVKGDPESDAVRDHREMSILMRTELNAIVGLLLAKGVFTQEEFQKQLEDEAIFLNKAYAERWPGVSANEMGLSIDHRAFEFMRGWRP